MRRRIEDGHVNETSGILHVGVTTMYLQLHSGDGTINGATGNGRPTSAQTEGQVGTLAKEGHLLVTTFVSDLG